MKLKDIIDIANEHYGGGWEVDKAHTLRNSSVDYRVAEVGDTLAVFIAKELEETFNGDKPDSEQLAEAVRVMERARDDIAGVVDALETERLRALSNEDWARRNRPRRQLPR